MKLDDEIRQTHDRYWTREQNQALQKTVILVEGEDDRSTLEVILDATRGPRWRARVHIVAAGGHKKVLEKRVLFPHSHGLIDRDVCSDHEVDSLRTNDVFLHITHGWCLENVFLDPTFLQKHFPHVFADISNSRERWVRAGAVWWTLQRAHERYHRWWDTLRSSPYGQPRDDFDPSTATEFSARFPVAPATPVNVAELAQEFESRLHAVEAMSDADQWRLGVHGKEAFRHLLVPSLERRIGGANWRKKLADIIGRPAPLDLLFATLGI